MLMLLHLYRFKDMPGAILTNDPWSTRGKWAYIVQEEKPENLDSDGRYLLGAPCNPEWHQIENLGRFELPEEFDACVKFLNAVPKIGDWAGNLFRSRVILSAIRLAAQLKGDAEPMIMDGGAILKSANADDAFLEIVV